MADIPLGPTSPRNLGDHSRPWFRELNRYHWFVLMVAALGWLFDCLDQQLFTLARQPAMMELLGGPGAQATADQIKEYNSHVAEWGSYATSIFLMGWASGGIIFGVLGDRIGRAKTMLWTILLYSLFTGLSALSTGPWDFSAYRFLTGLGVGGEFAVGVSLVAEAMPDRARPFALGLLQALSAVGNVSAAVINMILGQMVNSHYLEASTAWRYMFVVGTLPALMAVVVFRYLKEPERWKAAAHEGAAKRQLGSYREMFGDPRWRRHAIIGLLLAFAGVVGLWGIGFFTVDLMDSVLRERFRHDMSPAQLESTVSWWKGVTSIMQNVGGFFGIWAFSRGTHLIGRKPAFAIAFIAAFVSTALVFWKLNEFSQIFWMVPIMGFCQLSLFGGYAIYFPELFPTRLRSTGTSFCYNVGRFVAAGGPATRALLIEYYTRQHFDEPWRYAGITMCVIFLVGLFALPFAPETRGKPLPE
jgi:MFS family permease